MIFHCLSLSFHRLATVFSLPLGGPDPRVGGGRSGSSGTTLPFSWPSTVCSLPLPGCSLVLALPSGGRAGGRVGSRDGRIPAAVRPIRRGHGDAADMAGLAGQAALRGGGVCPDVRQGG